MLLIGIIILLDGWIVSLFSNFNIGNAIVVIAGVAIIAYAIFINRIKHIKIINYIILICLSSFFAIAIFIFIAGRIDTVNFTEDAVIVLGAGIKGDTVGAGLASRLDKCVEYVSKNDKAVIVVSGGQGPQENISEALAMERYLIDKGISKDKIIKEDKSTSTFENFKFSKEILDSKFGERYNVAYITNDFHIYRAGVTAKRVGLEVSNFSAGIEFYMIPPTYAREVLAVLKMWVVK
ncbi:MAG: hypothetical protein A2Y18_00860 [Clostridiales bacterium GWD2_32_19]|nr:MAG: hypothetical protein A2Y18_00860 [Clostridiales bacterium GWD2_32_19]